MRSNLISESRSILYFHVVLATCPFARSSGRSMFDGQSRWTVQSVGTEIFLRPGQWKMQWIFLWRYEPNPIFFSHQTKKIVDNNTASLFRVLFLELLSLVIGESVREREQNIFGLWKEARPNWGATSRLLCPYIVNSKLQKQIGIGSISSSKTATLN